MSLIKCTKTVFFLQFELISTIKSCCLRKCLLTEDLIIKLDGGLEYDLVQVENLQQSECTCHTRCTKIRIFIQRALLFFKARN